MHAGVTCMACTQQDLRSLPVHPLAGSSQLYMIRMYQLGKCTSTCSAFLATAVAYSETFRNCREHERRYCVHSVTFRNGREHRRYFVHSVMYTVLCTEHGQCSFFGVIWDHYIDIRLRAVISAKLSAWKNPAACDHIGRQALSPWRHNGRQTSLLCMLHAVISLSWWCEYCSCKVQYTWASDSPGWIHHNTLMHLNMQEYSPNYPLVTPKYFPNNPDVFRK